MSYGYDSNNVVGGKRKLRRRHNLGRGEVQLTLASLLLPLDLTAIRLICRDLVQIQCQALSET